MNYFAEFKRIANIANKYFKGDHYDIALGVLMVDHNIRNAYLFHLLEPLLIPPFFRELNKDSDKKYNFIIDGQFISKKGISETQSTGKILGYIQPEWYDYGKYEKYAKKLVLVINYNNNRIYSEVAGLTPQYKLEMEKKQKYYTDFLKKLSLDHNITVSIENVKHKY